MKQGIAVLCTTMLLASCTYFGAVSKQKVLRTSQETDPRLHNLKHLISQETFAVYGLISDSSGRYSSGAKSLSVVAFSSDLKCYN